MTTLILAHAGHTLHMHPETLLAIVVVAFVALAWAGARTSRRIG